jgi:hypothetical protein
MRPQNLSRKIFSKKEASRNTRQREIPYEEQTTKDCTMPEMESTREQRDNTG